jgi:hypothetical protein
LKIWNNPRKRGCASENFWYNKAMENKIKNLGCANGWTDESLPIEYEQHVNARHFELATVKKLGNCWYEYTCPICKIRYNVDSSD